MRPTNASQPNLRDHLRTEHRLTTLENGKREHSRRITALEKDRVPPKISIRDWLMSMAGFLVLLAALMKRISISDAISILSGLK